MTPFSHSTRKLFFQNASHAEYDLVVIGGGITGAGILLDAVSRGLKVLLVEMRDFASGTSGRSTKLIHGGLRYLKNYEFKLVADVGRERAIVFRNGPHITKSDPMLLPIIKGGSMGKFMASFGVWMYDYLANVKKEERRKVLLSEKVSAIEPLLIQTPIDGGILYYEYRTDDSRLTIEIIKKAVELGVAAINYCSALKFNYENEKIKGLELRDELSGEVVNVAAKYVVNAAGPWVDEVMSKDKATNSPGLILTKGVHLVFPFEKLPVKQSLYFENKDKRMIFIIPREGKTYVGTTDTFYEGDIKEPKVEKTDVDYLIGAIRNVLPTVSLKSSDMESSWAGLRPLIREEGKSPSEISRKDEIFVSNSGLISVAGGKLTGYRLMADKVTNKVVKMMKKGEGKNFPACKTASIFYSGGDVNGYFKSFVQSSADKAKDLGISQSEAAELAESYGSNVQYLFGIIRDRVEDQERSGLSKFLYARLIYAIQAESVMHAADFFIRRSSMLYFRKKELIDNKEKVLSLMKRELGWTEEEFKRNKEELDYVISLTDVPLY